MSVLLRVQSQASSAREAFPKEYSPHLLFTLQVHLDCKSICSYLFSIESICSY